jgi:hypothetical protein
MHLLPGVAKQPNLESKTRPKQLLGSLLLVIALPGQTDDSPHPFQATNNLLMLFLKAPTIKQEI